MWSPALANYEASFIRVDGVGLCKEDGLHFGDSGGMRESAFL